MTFKKDSLLTALNTVKTALTRGDENKTSSYLTFTKTHIVSFNEIMSVKVPFITDEKFTINGNDFIESINQIEDDKINITVSVKEVLLEGSTFKVGLKVLEDIDSIDFKLPLLNKWEIIDTDFLNGLVLCSFSASNDVLMGVLGSVCVKKDCLISSDNYRISKYDFKNPVKNEFLLPATVAADLIKFKPTFVYQEKNWIHFMLVDKSILSVVKITGDYPDVDKFLDIQGKHILVLPADLKKKIDAIIFMASGDKEWERSITISVEPDKIICRGEKIKGWAETIIPGDFKTTFKFNINPVFLSQILEKSTTMIVDDKVALFKTDNFKHVISLFA